ncbi:MAG: very short patch repair endonuclease [Hyphomicrobiales bacterium]
MRTIARVETTRRDPEVVSRAMRSVRHRDTTPERLLRSALWRRGLRFRLRSNLPGKPDIVFPGPRVAVFVDGDFWHGRQWLTRGFASLEAQMERVHGAEYWVPKLKRTIARDKATTERLRRDGWAVVRLWESDVKRDPSQAADEVVRVVGRKP